jgi:DNA primase
MSFSKQQIQKAKSVPILELLASKGFKHVQISGGEYKFYSPLNPDEKTPSFYVNPLKNVFRDFSTDNKGDSITLLQKLDKVDFSTAVNRLLDFSGFEIMYEPDLIKTRAANAPYSTVLKNLPLSSPNLIEYFHNRRIDVDTAKLYVKEVNYINPKGKFYGAGFKNDEGGFEIRALTKNGNVFKCFVGNKKSITTIPFSDNETVLLFEGFTDFLSYLTFYKLKYPFCNTIILNSTSLLSVEVVNKLSKFTVIESYLDNDKAGKEALFKLEKYLDSKCLINNKSASLYPNHNDFNDFLRSQFIPTWQKQKQKINGMNSI